MQDKDTARKILDGHIKDWQPIIEALPYPVSIHDTEFNVVLANKAFTDICGRTDVKGMKCYQLIHCRDEPVEDCPVAKTLKSGNQGKSEIYEPILKKYLFVQTSPIFVEGSLVGIIHSVMDISDIKDSEMASKELTNILSDSLNEVRKREDSLRESRDAFLNMLGDLSESYKELEDLFARLVIAMVNALDAKSPWTKGHSERVTNYALEIAREMGLKDEDFEHLKLCGLLHDIGKIGLYDGVLDKPDKLTDDEFELVKKHPEKGVEILSPIKQLSNIIPGILHHHERYDGKGYPEGIRGEDIPLCARILAAADSYDSMTADRPYRLSPGREYAISELKRCSGTQFDPRVVEAFLKVLNRL